MAKLDTEEIRALADLARLSMNDEEAAAFAPQMSQILAYIETLAAVDVDGVEPFVGPDLPKIALRADEAGPSFAREALLAGASAHDGTHVLVPQFKEEG